MPLESDLSKSTLIGFLVSFISKGTDMTSIFQNIDDPKLFIDQHLIFKLLGNLKYFQCSTQIINE